MKTKITYYLLLILILFAGIYIRTDDSFNVMTGNTITFFYARARDLHITNQYPVEDKLNYAPEVFKEDYPPLPAYFTVSLYRISNLFLNTSFYDFILFFPIFMYVILFILGFFIIGNLYNKTAGFFFSALLTIMPAANLLTRKGYYTEEALGVFLILLFFFFFIKSEKKRKYIYPAIIALTLLTLTWQIFILIQLGVLIYFIIYKKGISRYLLILILPLLIGHIISVNIIGIDYSPVYMFKETYMGYKYESTEDFQIAFHRGKLKSMDISRYTEEYSYFGLIFFMLGLFVCAKNFKKPKYSILLIYSILSFIAINKYIKFRFLALVFILILSSIGLDCAYKFDIFAKLNLGKYVKKYWKILSILSFIIIIALIPYYIRDPKCEIDLILPEENLEIGETYDIILQIRNVGKGALCSKTSFSGVHIEVENATIIEKKIQSSTTPAKIIEKSYTSNEADWFEAKFDCLKHNETGIVTFSIKPYTTPVKVNYRCWIPQFCLKLPPKNINPLYKAAWRNEKCLHRKPSGGSLCRVPVYAGYTEKQDYYCKNILLY
ncbi:MAG: hypothetical protein L6408_05860 [Nanoarchaeota archaeon]|nr:hypothetical protein [Nanoarchaeota archaeon]